MDSCNSKTDEEISRAYDQKQLMIKKQDSVSQANKTDRIQKLRENKIDTNIFTDDNIVSKLTVYGSKNPENKIRITTTFGTIDLKLYDDTPLHRANFIYLIKHKFFDQTLFYRVIDQFMIQGGSSDRDDITTKMSKIGYYTVPDEIQKHHIHKRGALAMAVKEQLDVPEEERHKRSSSFNFYIVQNGPLSDNYLDGLEKRYKIDISGSRRSTYRKIGGVPHLDDKFTVFGEVTKGIGVVDQIARSETVENDRPLKEIFLSIEIFE